MEFQPASRLGRKLSERKYERKGTCNCKGNASTNFPPKALEAIRILIQKK